MGTTKQEKVTADQFVSANADIEFSLLKAGSSGMDVMEVAEEEERNEVFCDVQKILQGTMKIFMEKSSNFS